MLVRVMRTGANVKRITITLLGLCLLFSATVFAGAWSPATTLSRVYIDGSGNPNGFFVDNINPDGCTYTTSWKTILITHPGADSMMSMLLSAAATGQYIQYYVSGCYNGVYPRITAIQLYPAD